MSVSYIVREGFSGFKRARLAAATSITALVIAVLLAGLIARIGYNAYSLAHYLRQQVELEVFLKDLNTDQTAMLKRELQSRKTVAQVDYISKDSAAAIFLRDFGNEGKGLASLDFLPASFRIHFADDASILDIKAMVGEVRSMKQVDDVAFNEQLLDVLESRIRTVGIAGLSVALLIILASLLLVYNTIRLTIYAKQNIIRAMKLVGATDGFIRRPFIVEGMLQGFIAAVISVAAMFALFQYAVPKFIPQLGILAWPFGRWYYLCAAMIVLSIFMGLTGSRWAAKRFIKSVQVGS